MNYVGYMVGNNDYLIQLASLLSVYLVSFFLVFVSILFSSNYRNAFLGVVIFSMGLMFGVYRVEYMVPKAHIKEQVISVRLVNANISQAELLRSNGTFLVVDKYIELSKASDEGVPELIIWPESVFQLYVTGSTESYRNRKYVTNFLNEGQILISGGPRFEFRRGGGAKFFSSMFQLNASGEITGKYDKHRLVPWGEYIPYRNYFPESWADIFDVKDYTPGDGGLSINYNSSIEILPLLCAEGHFPTMLNKYQKSQNFILMLGNEAWLEGTTEPSQYFVNARYRAVESGLPVLLASNKGYLAIIDNKGLIKNYLYENKPSVLDGYLKVVL